MELWERFGYYGVQDPGGLLVGLLSGTGFITWRAGFGLRADLIGGYVTAIAQDRHFWLLAPLLAIAADGMLPKPQLIFIALGTALYVGNGLFSQPGEPVSKCYPPKDAVDGHYPVLYR